MRIAAILRSKRSPQRVTVKFEDGDSQILPVEVAMAARLRRGQDLNDDDLRGLQNEAERWRCREAALRLIGFRARSGRELRGKLLQRGFSVALVEQCVSDLFEAGLLDDRAFALAFASDRLRSRPVGRSRLLYELRSKGVDESTARAAVEEAYAASPDDELELARRAARRFRRRSGEDEARAKRRLFGLLSRRGFSREAIKALSRELLG